MLLQSGEGTYDGSPRSLDPVTDSSDRGLQASGLPVGEPEQLAHDLEGDVPKVAVLSAGELTLAVISLGGLEHRAHETPRLPLIPAERAPDALLPLAAMTTAAA